MYRISLRISSIVECRQGWKTYGNGYFIYTSETSFSTTNQFNIHGIFSAMPNVTSKHALLSVYDADDVFAFQIMIGSGELILSTAKCKSGF